MNHTSFVGNLAADPQLHQMSNGRYRATMRIAVNEGERGSEHEKTHWIPVTVFDSEHSPFAQNVAASLKKGMRVIVEGRFDTYSQEVVKNGETINQTMVAFKASALGADLRGATADVTKNVRENGQTDFGSAANGQVNGEAQQVQQAQATPAAPAPATAAAAAAAPAGGDMDDF